MAEILQEEENSLMDPTTATNAEFKFNCPICGQHIAVAEEWCDWQINCPSCQTSITVPSQPQDKMKVKQALPPFPKTQTEAPGEFSDDEAIVGELVT